jgi:hypothetical protein
VKPVSTIQALYKIHISFNPHLQEHGVGKDISDLRDLGRGQGDGRGAYDLVTGRREGNGFWPREALALPVWYGAIKREPGASGLYGRQRHQRTRRGTR